MRIGIDLGGTNIAAGLVDEKPGIVLQNSVKTPQGAKAAAQEMAVLAHSLCAEAGIRLQDIESVGIGSPGAIDSRSGMVVYSNNLEYSNVPLAAMLSEQIGLPVRIGNDANAAALGEYHGGAGRRAAAGNDTTPPFSSMILVTLGTGVGGGIIVNGSIYDGFNGMGGEVGHMVIEVDGASCTCGRNGCWEAYASATGLIRLTKKAMECHPDSLMHSITAEKGKISGRTAFLAARKGDPAGDAVVETYCKYLAIGTANLINLFQPAMFCFGGGVSNEGQLLIDRLRPLLAPELYTVGDKRTSLCLAQLGNAAGIIGAALL